jgi:hypothetical protein
MLSRHSIKELAKMDERHWQIRVDKEERGEEVVDELLDGALAGKHILADR